MKSAFIQMMTVVVFATSIPAFAMAENPKAAKDNNFNSTNVGSAVETNVPPAFEGLLENVHELQGRVQELESRDKENKAVKKVS